MGFTPVDERLAIQLSKPILTPLVCLNRGWNTESHAYEANVLPIEPPRRFALLNTVRVCICNSFLVTLYIYLFSYICNLCAYCNSEKKHIYLFCNFYKNNICALGSARGSTRSEINPKLRKMKIMFLISIDYTPI